MNRLATLLIAVLVAGAVTYSTAFFQVGEWQQALVLQFGKPIKVVSEPGLGFKMPFVQNVVYFEKRLLEYDASPRELITRDKQQLRVDNYSRWRIEDPLLFYQTVQTQTRAQSRLDDIIYSNLREAIGKSTISELVSGNRGNMMADVTKQSAERAKAYGVELIDIRIKRADLPEKNEQTVFSRMRTERERQAKKFRAEGEEESRKVRSQAEKDRQVVAEAKREGQVIRGEAEAKATKIYAEAYNGDPDFYKFSRKLEAYRKALAQKTTVVLDPSSEFLSLLKGADQ